MSELKHIFAQSKEIQIGEKKVAIKDIALGDIPRLLDLVGKYFEITPKKNDPDFRQFLIKEIVKDYGKLIGIFEITTDLTAEEVRKLNIGSATLIFNNVVKENADFFVQHVVPMLKGMAETATSLAGTNQSKS